MPLLFQNDHSLQSHFSSCCLSLSFSLMIISARKIHLSEHLLSFIQSTRGCKKLCLIHVRLLLYKPAFFPLDAVICKDPSYSLGHRAVSLSLSHRALVLRSTIGNVPNLFHAHRSLCFSFLRKGLEHVPQFGEPEEKNLRTEAAKNIEVFFFACERKCDKFEKVTHNGSH